MCYGTKYINLNVYQAEKEGLIQKHCLQTRCIIISEQCILYSFLTIISKFVLPSTTTLANMKICFKEVFVFGWSLQQCNMNLCMDFSQMLDKQIKLLGYR